MHGDCGRFGRCWINKKIRPRNLNDMEMMQQASTYSDQVQEADSISDNPEQFLRLDSLLFSIASIR